MPIEHAVSIKRGTTARSILVYLRHRDQPQRGRTGLRWDEPRAGCAFIREGDPGPTPVRLADGALEGWAPGAFAEVDPERLPGIYRFGLPDQVVAPGSPRAVVAFRFEGVRADPVEIDLVGYDPQDPNAVGIDELSNEKRHKFLHAAMPGVTVETYAGGEQVARTLTDTIRSTPKD